MPDLFDAKSAQAFSFESCEAPSLAHVKGKVTGADGQGGMRTILELYDRLSPEDRERVLAELAAREREPT